MKQSNPNGERMFGSGEEKSANISKKEVLERVSRALDQIQFGEIVIKVQGGKPVWVDKYERERVG